MAEAEKDDLVDDVRAAMTELQGGGDGDAGKGNGAGDRASLEGGAERGEPSNSGSGGEVQGDGRARDESGRFARKEGDKPRETLSLKEKPAPSDTTGTKDNAGQPATNGTQQPTSDITQPADKPAAILAPTEWKGAAKVKWDRLPREVQAEIVERHTASEQRLQQYAPLEQAIAPYKDAWTRDAGGVPHAIEQLGQFYRLYLENPVGLIHHIARSRGIDLGAPQGQQPPQGGAPQQPPDIASFVQQAVQQAIAPFQEQTRRTETQALNETISAFAADPKHPYFQDVKVHMGQLLQTGAAKDLNEAYDQAIWANPTIRAQLMSAQAEEAKKAQAAEVERANKARAASLRGSPLPNGSNQAGQGNNSSVLDDVRAAAAEIAGNA